MRTRLRAAHVIGNENGRHVLWRDGEVVFEDDRILFVGRGFDGALDRDIDHGFALIGPGFVDLDALGDLDTAVLTFDNGPEWRLGRVWSEDFLRSGPAETYTAEEESFKVRYAFAQLLRNGITTAMPITSMLYRAWAESYDETAEVARIAEAMGIRAYLGPCYMSGLTFVRDDGSLHQHWDEARGLAGLDDAARFARDFDGRANGRIRAFLAPDRIETQTPAVLARTAAVQREIDAPMRLHCCQSAYEFETVLRLRGATPLGWLERLGLLGPRAILPHGVYRSGHAGVSRAGDEDTRRLAASGATIVHCPIVWNRDGEALGSFSALASAGVRFAMGTDTFPPDMIENIRWGLAFGHLMDGGRKATTAADFYDAATLGGAAALGRDDLGRLAPGAKADIVVFDLTGFHLGQVVDPLKALAIAGGGRDVVAVHVDGRQVVDHGQLPGIDLDAMRRQADRQFRKAILAHQDRAVGRPPLDRMFRSSYPPR